MPADRRPRPARGAARPPARSGAARSGPGLARPRGPLPARVYWTRRLVLLGLVLATVVGVGRVLGTGSDGDTARDRAVTASAVTSPAPDAPASSGPPASTPASPGASQGPVAVAKPKRARTPRKPPPATPTGRCEDSDVRVAPVVEEAVGGSDITIGLELRTIEAAACFWRVSPRSLALTITSGDDPIWTSRECPRAVPRRTVVVRSAQTTTIDVAWSGRRSDEDCSRLTEWALPGWYHVEAAALAGEPADLQFEVTAPEPEVITRTVEPPQRDRARGRARGQQDGGAAH